jgi:ribose transport system permease protein
MSDVQAKDAVAAAEAATEGAEPDGQHSRWRSAFAFKRISGLYVWAAIFILFSLWVPDKFLTKVTWTSLAADQAVTTIVALGLVVALAAGVFDLSVGAVLGASAAITAHLMVEEHWNPVLAMLAALVFGLVVGLVNGIIVVRFKVDSFIATLGMSSVLTGLTEWLTKNQQIVGISNGFKKIATLKPLGIPIPFFYMLAIALVLWYILQLTPIGRYLYATGGSREIARLAGVRPERWIYVALLTSSFVASIGGIIVLARVSGAGPTLGATYVLPVFAAAFLGATQFQPGRFNIWGTVVAVYLLATGTKGLQLVGYDPWVDKLFYGAALIIAVALAGFEGRQRLRARRQAAAGTASATAAA